MNSNGGSSNSDSRSTTKAYAIPTPKASLLLSFRPTSRKVLIIGTKRLAASRIFSILEADAIPVVVGTDCSSSSSSSASSSSSGSTLNEEVKWRIDQGQCQFLAAPQEDSLEAWNELIDSIDGDKNNLFSVCVTDTLHAGDEEESESKSKGSPISRARLLVSLCRSRRIPINVADQPLLCDYSFPASHRFSSSSSPLSPDSSIGSTSSSLQIAVTTNGKGCRLAGRIRREIVSKLPRNVGDAVERVGEMREMAKQKRDPVSNMLRNGNSESVRRSAILNASGSTTGSSSSSNAVDVQEDDLTFDSTPLNSPVPQLASSSKADGFFTQVNSRLQLEGDEVEERRRRMRWVAQMSEYWPIEYLGGLSAADMAKALDTYVDKSKTRGEETPRGRKTIQEAEEAIVGSHGVGSSDMKKRDSSQHSLSLVRPAKTTPGHIFLVGSGTGHPGLLTTFAHNLLTSCDTDLILSDKLVPSSILCLIPKSTPLQIARKFPGNAEGAQSELISLALQGAIQGKRVIRLKQGDPFVYGRGGEEVLAFQKAGIHVTVVPGISSALAAPLMLGIPVTQRGAADSLTLCTGVGRGGKSVRLPGYERSRSLIVLMGVARLKDVVKTLCYNWKSLASLPTEIGKEGEICNDGHLMDTPAGQRVGDAFPPYTPIAIIERASSSDQRLVASTLQGIEMALTRSGEQRPPGMMLIGWAALSLSGVDGNVDVLDDEAECVDNAAELEKRDQHRVRNWLGESGYVIKEGLDEFYSQYLNMWEESQQQQEDKMDAVPLTYTDVEGKGASGWAPPRYGDQGPKGGWGHDEKQLS